MYSACEIDNAQRCWRAEVVCLQYDVVPVHLYVGYWLVRCIGMYPDMRQLTGLDIDGNHIECLQ